MSGDAEYGEGMPPRLQSAHIAPATPPQFLQYIVLQTINCRAGDSGGAGKAASAWLCLHRQVSS
jgi:hypothetical protein